ncbi:MAG: peptidoglycan DD-metalloendopeptidase family protein [Pseudomonadales bacterium]|nr:peptidoglycan DD-metalloendopeptidase family protein [Pseudomonadales bacterium]
MAVTLKSSRDRPWQRLFRCWLASLALLAALGSPLLMAATTDATSNPAEVEAQLKKLEAEISKFKEMLKATQGEKSSLEDNLRMNEQEINELLKKIESIQSEMQQGEKKISRLQGEKKNLIRAKQEQQQLIARQIRAAREIGTQPMLKVLLNQEDPVQVDRMVTYYDYFNRARARQIEDYQDTIVQLDNVSASLAREQLALAANKQQLDQQRSSLLATREARQQVLKDLNRQIASQGNEIGRLTENRAQLEALLTRITESVLQLPTPDEAVSFVSRKGIMELPVAGQVTHRFGARRSGGKVSWDGVFITAPAGEPVHAVHYGRVVFSDWLRGFGLLLIISHGDGFMSLYGHNQVLYRETGDWVSAGDVISSVGDTGGQQEAGLYFEIRNAGKPTNPQQWCKARTQRGKSA